MNMSVGNNKLLFFLSISLVVGICFWLFKNYEMYNKALKFQE